MSLKELIDLMNEGLMHEYQHMLFYTHAANVLVGLERLYLADKLKEHAKSEMEHVFQFSQKIMANGVLPVCGWSATPLYLCNGEKEFPTKAVDILVHAVKIEEEVVSNYHERHKQASALNAETGKHYDLVIFLEEQIEHSQGDIDELKLVLMGLK